jgi:hypothetical protein
MTPYETGDAGLEELKRLRTLTPDPSRADRVRVRCRAKLARRRTRQGHTEVVNGFARQVLAPVVVGGFCVLYIAVLVTAIIRILH